MSQTPCTFEVGKTYTARSVCDHDSVFFYTILKRTAKTVTVKPSHGEAKLCRITIRPDTGTEYIKPNGSYSMCLILSAHRELKEIS